MLRLLAGQAVSLWDDALPIEVRELPEGLAALDRLLDDPVLLEPIVARFRQELAVGRAVLMDGRPTIAMETYVRLMVLKQRYRWGYRTLVAESRTRSTCGGSVGSRCRSGSRTSRRCASSRGGSGPRR